MKKTISIITIVVLLFSCKPVENSTKTNTSTRGETSLVETENKGSKADVTAHATAETETNIEQNTTKTGVKINLSEPDSLGKQHPTSIEKTGEQTSIKTASITKLETEWNAKFERQEKRITELEKTLKTQSEEKTVSKTGLTFFQKLALWVGGVSFLVLLLIIVYQVAKRWIKKQIPVI
ncbi:MAG: hypothetical protein LBN27_05865 [Prevotellaceae bacterium]|jgi:hypothetical protein|nr:hypothetical protein [Prevotellaceae bacterium]